MNRKRQSINIINAIQKNIIQRNLLKPNIKIFLCVSGGQDSSCLIFIILFLKNQWNWSIGIIYSNHLWQQKSFFIFLELARIIYKLNLRFIYSISLEKLTNENNSRKWRYNNFYRLCYFYDTLFLLTGHTFSDRLETLLFNMLRGSGINSFYFLDWKRNNSLLHEKNHFFCIKKFPNITITTRNQFPRTEFQERSFTNVVRASAPRGSCANKGFAREHGLRPVARAYFFPKEKTKHGNRNSFKKNKIEFFDYRKKLYFISVFLNKKNDLGSLKEKRSSNTKVHANTTSRFTRTEFEQVRFEVRLGASASHGLSRSKPFDLKIFPFYNRNYLNNVLLHKFFYCSRKKNQTVKVIRPLLSLNRVDIKQVVSNYNLFVFLDKSNQSKKYSRNRIRNQLLPTLRFFFNPQIDSIFFQYSEIGAFEENYFDYLTTKLIIRIEYKTNLITSIDTSLFKNLPKSLQRRIYKFFLEKTIKKTISFAQSELLISSILCFNKNTLQNEKQYKCFLYPKFGVFLIYKNQLCIIT